MYKYPIKILPVAEECLDRLDDYFRFHSPHFADFFAAEISHIVYDVLTYNPQAGRAVE